MVVQKLRHRQGVRRLLVVAEHDRDGRNDLDVDAMLGVLGDAQVDLEDVGPDLAEELAVALDDGPPVVLLQRREAGDAEFPVEVRPRRRQHVAVDVDSQAVGLVSSVIHGSREIIGARHFPSQSLRAAATTATSLRDTHEYLPVALR